MSDTVHRYAGFGTWPGESALQPLCVCGGAWNLRDGYCLAQNAAIVAGRPDGWELREVLAYNPGKHTFVKAHWPWLAGIRVAVMDGGVFIELYEQKDDNREHP